MTSYPVLDQTVQTPVQIRYARSFIAGYSVDLAPAQRLIDYSGLELVTYRPGKALAQLIFVDYIDGDLGPYNEFGLGFMVRNSSATSKSVAGDLRSLLTGNAGAFIHELPVDGEFTLAAGRGIWGFPKTMGTFDVDHNPKNLRGSVSLDNQKILDIALSPGLPIPGIIKPTTTMNAYCHLDGITRSVPWTMKPTELRARPGGAYLTLGNHRIADEMRSLNLSKQAVGTVNMGRVAMSFADATVVN